MSANRTTRRHARMLAFALVATGACGEIRTPIATPDEPPHAAALDALSAWNDGPTKASIVEFVTRVTTSGGPGFVPEEARIAVFDNDGTLWTEQPVYTEVAFTLDRVRALAPSHPEWRGREPFASVVSGDAASALHGGTEAIMPLFAATHAGMTTDEFASTVDEWIRSARHPRFGRSYTELAFAPMVQLLRYLEANGFTTFIVSGGDVAFMRPWAEATYGIPPERVVGSSVQTHLEERDGRPVLVREPELALMDDGPGKVVGIDRAIGRRPILAFGNSDGDLQMLEWTMAGDGARFAGLVHHTDAAREAAYDRASAVGRLDRALDEAVARGWVVVDVRSDWRDVFAFEPSTSDGGGAHDSESGTPAR